MPDPVRQPPRGALRSWRQRFKAAVKDNFLVRFHMAIILTGVTLVGMAANKALYLAGVQLMQARYPIAVLAAYGAFFLGVWIWIAYVRAAAPASLTDPALAAPVLVAALAANPAGDARRYKADGSLGNVDAGDVLDGAEDAVDGLGSIGDAAGSADEGAVWLLVLLLVAAILIAAGWLVWQAPAILSEAAFSATLAGAVRKAARGEDGPNWAWHVLKKSIVPFAVVALVAGGVGFGVRVVCPQARTVKAALNCDQKTAEFLAE